MSLIIGLFVGMILGVTVTACVAANREKRDY